MDICKRICGWLRCCVHQYADCFALQPKSSGVSAHWLQKVRSSVHTKKVAARKPPELRPNGAAVPLRSSVGNTYATYVSQLKSHSQRHTFLPVQLSRKSYLPCRALFSNSKTADRGTGLRRSVKPPHLQMSLRALYDTPSSSISCEASCKTDSVHLSTISPELRFIIALKTARFVDSPHAASLRTTQP